MNENTKNKLEYDRLIEHFKTYATSSLGKNLIDKISPSPYIKVVQKRLDETKEAISLLSSSVPLQGVGNIQNIVEQVEKGLVLDCDNLLQVSDFLRGTRKVIEFFVEKEAYTPILFGYSKSLTSLKDIEDEINQSITKGRVDINASKELKRIRRHIDIEQGKIEEKLQKFISVNKKYLESTIITKRQDRYTIQVKAAYKNQVAGAQIDKSNKGTTIFIEPQIIQKHTSALISLKAEEELEEYKILAMLTELVNTKLQEIKINIEVIAEYDLIFAKGKYAIAIDAIMPKINADGYINIVKGKHPLLKGNVVPLDLEIGEDYSALAITGPNAGGKTVVLKTVGLLTIMTQLGLFIPASEKSHIAIYEKIFVDIGDNQSIENSLSTFSSHIKNLASIIKQADKKSLVLLDEIGSGTDPNEGAALAIAILEELYKKQTTIIVTTHYGEIKNYSKAHPDFNTAKMEFNEETLEPLYKLVIGKSGKSNALYISKKMGVPAHVINRAELYIKDKNYNLEKIERKIKKIKPIEELQSYQFEKGDKVLLLDTNQEGIIYSSQDKSRNAEVFVNNEIIKIYEKRIKLLVTAENLYPDDYDLDSLFVDFKIRKQERDIARGSKKALKKIQKEIKNNRI
ncbi:mannonate oxidoreductase [Candidatus Epulonipiscioides gigas]|nr:mannonate oxidoreductase [Epulopiscium sp. SCG-C07WGA-EpuloA2]